MTRKGYYSLIQYCPNHGRDERLNVALVALVENRDEPGRFRIDVRFSKAAIVRAVCLLGGHYSFVEAATVAIRHPLEREFDGTPESVERFAAKLGNDIQITKPRGAVFCEDCNPEIDDMVAELLDPPTMEAAE